MLDHIKNLSEAGLYSPELRQAWVDFENILFYLNTYEPVMFGVPSHIKEMFREVCNRYVESRTGSPTAPKTFVGLV